MRIIEILAWKVEFCFNSLVFFGEPKFPSKDLK